MKCPLSSKEVAGMACVAPRSHDGDAGGDPPDDRRPRLLPHQCEVFEAKDQKTFKPVGRYGANFSSYVGELIKEIPLYYDSWEKVPLTDKAPLIPRLQTYFDLQPHLNDETVIKINGEDKTVGSLVRAGLQRDFARRYSDKKCKFKDKWFNKKTVEQARQEKPSKWKKFVDFWSEPDRMKQSERNAANRAKNKVTTHQGSKSFAQGRHEFFEENQRYEGLIDHWRRRHSDKDGNFRTRENETLYAEMKAIQDAITAGTIPPKTDRQILAEVTRSTNRAHIAGVGRNLAGTGNLDSGRSQPDPGYCTREQLEDLKRQHALEKEEQRKAFESQQNALKKFVDFFNRQQGTPSSQFEIPDLYTPQVFPGSMALALLLPPLVILLSALVIVTPRHLIPKLAKVVNKRIMAVMMVIMSMMSIFMMTSRDYVGRGVKQKKGDTIVKTTVNKENNNDDLGKGTTSGNVDTTSTCIEERNVESSSTSNVELNVEKEDTSSITAKIHDMERQILVGKLVLVGDDGLPFNAKHSSEVSSKTGNDIGNSVGPVSYAKLLHGEPRFFSFVIPGILVLIDWLLLLVCNLGFENVVAKDVVVPNVVDEPFLSSMNGPMAQRVTVSGNSSGTHDSSTTTPVECTVTESPPSLNKSGPSFSGPTSYAKLVTSEPSRKSVNFCTLITQAGNGAYVVVPLESIRAVSKRFANSDYGLFGKADRSLIGIIPAPVEKKKQAAVASKEVSHLNPFNVLNSIEKDDDFGTNEGHLKSVGKGLILTCFRLSTYSFDVASSSTSTTPIVERINKIERQIIDRKITLVDDNGKLLPKVISTKNMDSDSGVEDVVNDHAIFMASTCLKRGAHSAYGKPFTQRKNFRALLARENSRADIAITLDSVRVVNERFSNSVYGFFLGKRVKFHDFSISVFMEDGLSVIATKLDVNDGGGSKTASAQEVSSVEVHGCEDKHVDDPNSSSCDQPPIIEKEVNLKSVDSPRTSMRE
ncbi:acidic leucine-rich nuclear phosphoprotein 32 family member A [Tanacetum coccineum]